MISKIYSKILYIVRIIMFALRIFSKTKIIFISKIVAKNLNLLTIHYVMIVQILLCLLIYSIKIMKNVVTKIQKNVVLNNLDIKILKNVVNLVYFQKIVVRILILKILQVHPILGVVNKMVKNVAQQMYFQIKIIKIMLFVVENSKINVNVQAAHQKYMMILKMKNMIIAVIAIKQKENAYPTHVTLFYFKLKPNKTRSNMKNAVKISL